MKLIDLHCDTIDKLMEDQNANLYRNDFSIDIQKLKKSNSIAQVFAVYFDLDLYRGNPYNRFENMASKFYEQLDLNKNDIALAKNYQDILNNQKQNKLSAILSIEEGAALNGDIKNLYKAHEAGVRLITLTWNYENEIGYPHNKVGFENECLKPFGLEVIERMNELGMIIDVSHLNDGGFYDVSRNSKKPFIASHSNARNVTGASRNLTDDMIKVLGNKGGVTGINFCKFFLGESDISKVDDIVKHIKHIVNVGGIDVVAMGSDFDGIPDDLEMKDISQMYMLQNALLKSGFNEDEIEKMMYKNALRVIKDVL